MNILSFDSIKENKDIVDEITDNAHRRLVLAEKFNIRPSDEIMREAFALYSLEKKQFNDVRHTVSFHPIIIPGTLTDEYFLMYNNHDAGHSKQSFSEDMSVNIDPKNGAEKEAKLFLKTENRLSAKINHMLKMNGYLSSEEASKNNLDPMLKQLINILVDTDIRHSAQKMTFYRGSLSLVEMLTDAASNAYFRNNIVRDHHDMIQSSSTIDKYITYTVETPKIRSKK